MDDRAGRFDIFSTLPLGLKRAWFLVVSCCPTMSSVLSLKARRHLRAGPAGRKNRRKSKRRSGLVFSKRFRGFFIVSRCAATVCDFAPRFSPGARRLARLWAPRFPFSGRTIRRDPFIAEPLTRQGLRSAAQPSSPGPQTPLRRRPPCGSRSGAGWKETSPGLVPASERAARGHPAICNLQSAILNLQFPEHKTKQKRGPAPGASPATGPS